jgi:hypothetical protein
MRKQRRSDTSGKVQCEFTFLDEELDVIRRCEYNKCMVDIGSATRIPKLT